MVEFSKIDEMHENGDGAASYETLKSAFDAGANQDVELLWRLARCCYSQASVLVQKDPKKKELLFEGQKYIISAYELDKENFNVLKWCAVISGSITEFMGTKEKIQEGFKFKEYVDKAISMKPEYSLYHMRGRFAYSVASLSWLERKAASAFFATPPTATYEEALQDFLEVEKLRPNDWLENLIYIARCYIQSSDKANVAKYLNIAAELEPQDDADREVMNEVKQLQTKYCK